MRLTRQRLLGRPPVVGDVTADSIAAYGHKRSRAPRMGARLVDELLNALDSQTIVVPAEITIGRVTRDLATELSRLAAAREQLATEIEAVFTRPLTHRSC